MSSCFLSLDRGKEPRIDTDETRMGNRTLLSVFIRVNPWLKAARCKGCLACYL